ncbi:MAG: pilin [Candidatus Magasanikbacteria bacterium]
MKFKFGQLFLSLVILVGVFGFGGESFSANCSPYSTADGCNSNTSCRWMDGFCSDKQILFAEPKKVLVIGSSLFYDGCNDSDGFVKLLNKELNPNYVFECTSDSTYLANSIIVRDSAGYQIYKPYINYVNIWNNNISNISNIYNNINENGYDEILMDVSSVDAFLIKNNTDTVFNLDGTKSRLASIFAEAKSLNIRIVAVGVPPYRNIDQSNFDSKNEMVKLVQNFIFSNASVGVDLKDMSKSIDEYSIDEKYINIPDYSLSEEGHKFIKDLIITKAYFVSPQVVAIPQKTLEFCLCTSNNSSCETKKYNTKTICESDIKILQARGSNEKLQCVQVESGKACDSLVGATANEDKAGNNNSDLLNDLKPRISALNKLTVKDVPSLIGKIISTVLGILGSIALVMIMYGGLLWMTARGNSEKTQKAIQVLIWSTLGITIIFASYSIVNLVFDTFR